MLTKTLSNVMRNTTKLVFGVKLQEYFDEKVFVSIQTRNLCKALVVEIIFRDDNREPIVESGDHETAAKRILYAISVTCDYLKRPFPEELLKDVIDECSKEVDEGYMKYLIESTYEYKDTPTPQESTDQGRSQEEEKTDELKKWLTEQGFSLHVFDDGLTNENYWTKPLDWPYEKEALIVFKFLASGLIIFEFWNSPEDLQSEYTCSIDPVEYKQYINKL